MSTNTNDTLHTTDRTALARLEHYLKNNDVPRHVLDAFYHMKNSVNTLQYAEEKSRTAWLEALDKCDEQSAHIEALVNELDHWRGGETRNGAGVR